jgi:hypothetical protein
VGNNTGIRISSSAHDNTIGGTAAGDGNTIAFNSSLGVALVGSPFSAGTGNAIVGNSIFSNGGLGIDLGEDGVTANDHCDPDTGPNSLQNYPVATNVTSVDGTTTIDWISTVPLLPSDTSEFSQCFTVPGATPTPTNTPTSTPAGVATNTATNTPTNTPTATPTPPAAVVPTLAPSMLGLLALALGAAALLLMKRR